MERTGPGGLKNKQVEIFHACKSNVEPNQGIFEDIEFFPDHIWILIVQFCLARMFLCFEEFENFGLVRNLKI